MFSFLFDFPLERNSMSNEVDRVSYLFWTSCQKLCHIDLKCMTPILKKQRNLATVREVPLNCLKYRKSTIFWSLEWTFSTSLRHHEVSSKSLQKSLDKNEKPCELIYKKLIRISDSGIYISSRKVSLNSKKSESISILSLSVNSTWLLLISHHQQLGWLGLISIDLSSSILLSSQLQMYFWKNEEISCSRYLPEKTSKISSDQSKKNTKNSIASSQELVEIGVLRSILYVWGRSRNLISRVIPFCHSRGTKQSSAPSSWVKRRIQDISVQLTKVDKFLISKRNPGLLRKLAMTDTLFCHPEYSVSRWLLNLFSSLHLCYLYFS